MQFFFYGTLMDHDVRRAIFPHVAERLRIEPAVLPGYRRVRANCGDFPVLVRRSGTRVPGQLVGGMDPRAVMLMAHFEGEEYLPRPAPVIDGRGRRQEAWMFLAAHNRHVSDAPWRLETWRLARKRRLLPEIERWLAQWGAGDLHSVDLSWRMRRWLRARLDDGWSA